MSAIPLADISWTPCWRIIPSRFPPIDLFERIAAREDWNALADIETMTNSRVRQEREEVALVRREDTVAGPMSSLIMAPFTHPDPCGDRFTDGRFGVCYAAPTFEEALEMSVRRREEFLRRTQEGPIQLQMRVLNMDLQGTFHDLRGKAANDYQDIERSRDLGRTLRESGSSGVIYDGLLSRAGNGVAVFRPTVLSNCRQERHLAFDWNGTRVVQIYDYSSGASIKR